MSDTGPFAATLDLQRRALEHNLRAVGHGVAAQRAATAAVTDRLRRTGARQRQAIELARRQTHGALSAAAAPGADVERIRETYDEAVEQVLEAHNEAFSAVLSGYEDGTATTNEALKEYLETVRAGVDALADNDEWDDSESVDEQIRRIQERAAGAIKTADT